MSERIAGLIQDRTAEARESLENSARTLTTLFDESQARIYAQFEQHGHDLINASPRPPTRPPLP